MRRLLPLLCCAFTLGLGASGLVACSSTPGGIPERDAADLNRELADVQEFVQRGECSGLDGQLRQVQEGIDNLPSDVDAALVGNLQQGLDRLRGVSVTDCNEARTATTPTVTAATPPTVTETTPRTQTTTQTTPTTRTTPPTTTAAPPTTTTAPAPTQTGGEPPTPQPPGGAGPDEPEGGAGVTP